YMPVSGTVEVLGEALHDGCTVGEGRRTATGVEIGKQSDGGTLTIARLTTPRCLADAGLDGPHAGSGGTPAPGSGGAGAGGAGTGGAGTGGRGIGGTGGGLGGAGTAGAGAG